MMSRFTHRAALAATLLTMLLPLAALAADQPVIPLDRDGLPAWEIKQWTDAPVRLVLDDKAALDQLLAMVPIADFHREQVGIAWITPKEYDVVLRTRVTDAELAALEQAGYRPERLPDVERMNREASEKLWADMYAGKATDTRTDPLNYVPTNDQLRDMLQGIAADHPSIARYVDWGHSVEGRTLHGIVISDNVDQNEAEPEVRYSSSMHGDEITGMVLTVNLAYYLVEHYGQPGYEDVTDIVDNYELHLMPAHNPDGTVRHQRYNANGVDLNRNFEFPAGTHSTREIENIYFMEYANNHHFVVSLNYHGGFLVMNYVWDYTSALAPDNDACIEMSLDYSEANSSMYYDSPYPQGIVRGAVWYVATGTLQDWSYDQTDCIDTTCEVSNVKWPSNASLPGFWDDNRESMLAYMRTTLIGTIHGVVTDADTGLPLDAEISLVGNAKPTHTDPENGDYYKYAATGTYDVQVSALGYATQTVTGVSHTWGVGTELDVALQPLAAGQVYGTVTDSSGEGIAATIELRTFPAGALVETVTADADNGGAYSLDVFYGDFTLDVSAEGYFPASEQITVGDVPVELDFVLIGATASYPIVEGFEAGSGVFAGDWFVTTPGNASDHCLTDSEGDYPHGATLIASVDQVVDFSQVEEPRAFFAAKWNIESNYDAVFFEVSTNGGGTWTPVAVPGYTVGGSGNGVQDPVGAPLFEGSQANWVDCEANLSAFVGESDVRFRFRLVSDSSVHYDGFYLDDFRVEVLTISDPTAADVPGLVASVAAFPNPFNPQTTVKLVNPRQGPVQVAVFDVQGRCVRTLVSADLPAGEHTVAWDGTDDAGRRLGSGMYMARMVAGEAVTGTKLMLVK
jgi:carboxypeptidase D